MIIRYHIELITMYMSTMFGFKSTALCVFELTTLMRYQQLKSQYYLYLVMIVASLH